MATNNDDAPTYAQADSVRRLGEHLEAIADSSVRAFVERILARVEELKTQDRQGRQGVQPSDQKAGGEVIFTLSGSNENPKL